MIDIVSNNIVCYLEEHGYITREREIYLHGTKLLISYIIGTIIALTIAILTNTIVEFIIYEVSLYSSRSILGGYHSKHRVSCILTYVGIFVLGIMTIHFYNFNIYIFIIIQLLGIIITIIYCPVQNKKKELSDNKKRIFKKYSIIYILMYLCILNILYYINNQYVSMFLYTYMIINILTVGGVIDYEKHKE